MPQYLHKGFLFQTDYAGIVRSLGDANPDAADRFCEAVERALRLLASHPEAGTKAGFRHAPAVRKWVVHPFTNYLLFYEARADCVVVIRLLHGARDLPPLIPEN